MKEKKFDDAKAVLENVMSKNPQLDASVYLGNLDDACVDEN